MSEDITIWVRDQFVEVLEIDADEITEDSFFAEDLDADSIDLIEVVNRAEARWGVKIDEEQIYDIETVGQLVALLRATVGDAG